jgi:hypothetical protein
MLGSDSDPAEGTTWGAGGRVLPWSLIEPGGATGPAGVADGPEPARSAETATCPSVIVIDTRP